MTATDPVVIVGMARTPMGGLLGDLSGMSANELGSIAVKAAVESEIQSAEPVAAKKATWCLCVWAKKLLSPKLNSGRGSFFLQIQIRTI